jgi:hypothetical protein
MQHGLEELCGKGYWEWLLVVQEYLLASHLKI